MPESGGNKDLMRALKILHAADMHMDSPFEGLSSGKAALRRTEQRALLDRLAALAKSESVDLVLLSGDLLDGSFAYRETLDALKRFLGEVSVPVFIAPGNHDYYSAHSAYAQLDLPADTHIFTENRITAITLPELDCTVYGAAFTDISSPALLEGFSAPREDGKYNLLCIHGEVGAAQSRYNAISEAQLAASGIDYAALGHIHKASGLRKAGSTYYSWPGCPEGRGFDELGDRFVNIVTLDGAACSAKPVKLSLRNYEILRVDVSADDALAAVEKVLPVSTENDVYRIILTGETDAAPDMARLTAALSPRFFELQLRDETHLRRDIWESAGSDTLRGIFLSKMREKFNSAKSDDARALVEQAVKWGLAALDNTEEVVSHENK